MQNSRANKERVVKERNGILAEQKRESRAPLFFVHPPVFANEGDELSHLFFDAFIDLD